MARQAGNSFNQLKKRIIKHQLLAFFVLVYAISWPSMIIVYFVLPRSMLAQVIFGTLAVFSPAMIAMFISSLAGRGPKSGSRTRRPFVFLAAWLLAWFILVMHAWQVSHAPLTTVVIVFSGVVALIPAWFISGAYSRNPGVRRHFSTLLRPRGNVIWYLVALFVFPLIQLVGAAITMFAGHEMHLNTYAMGAGATAVFVLLSFLEGFLKSGGVNEESGWRGFALPRLQARYPVIVATAIVWLFWALWHLPYDLGNSVPVGHILLNRLFYNFLWSVYFAWVYNRTRGSILAPALFHPSMNTFGNLLPSYSVTKVLFVILALFAVVHDRMWKKLPQEHQAVYTQE